MVPEKYHKFLDVFSKKASDAVASHSKYNQRIELLNGGKDNGHAALRGMSTSQSKLEKKLLEKKSEKRFYWVEKRTMLVANFISEEIREGYQVLHGLFL